MSETATPWHIYQAAVNDFCFQHVISGVEANKLISSLIGEELEWCGSQGILFVLNQFIESDQERKELLLQSRRTSNVLESESVANSGLRNQLKKLQRSSEDNEWHLQEQLASVNNALVIEREINQDLRDKLFNASNKMYQHQHINLTSAPGRSWENEAGSTIISMGSNGIVANEHLIDKEEEDDKTVASNGTTSSSTFSISTCTPPRNKVSTNSSTRRYNHNGRRDTAKLKKVAERLNVSMSPIHDEDER
mmetsp:Transcript_21896/g.36652  ORF Transcript_21896/g.36652 Transcript_21896/m.36652 type:complete len:250 (-) Transcript_21896:1844-2593(-)|eukprot:CAMPEP_0175008400 /NCGR_PEP_ID=MMETSP0005-20121125/6955_1 /TAXON_ID=420556 /ORGANISM="Ochromonas sp., Strain CCMP1393" /LENGTH=249 /DNA_ID=CAMNT_0016263967 /DNA_START=60 /DNA_END=809 /DNA_ORIENTATION=+